VADSGTFSTTAITMLFNKAIIVLAIFSVKRGIATEIREEQRLRSTSINAKDSEVKKYIATNANSILPMDQVNA
jgi:glucose dehydrogenase